MDKRDLVERLHGEAQGIDLGAVGMGWSPDPGLLREAATEIERIRTENAALKREAHTREGAAEELYARLDSLSKAMESSGRIDEHEHPDAYGTILDAMKYVQSDLSAPETQPGATAFDGADAWNAYGA